MSFIKAVTSTKKGSVTTTLRDDTIIYNVLSGYITEAVAKEGLEQIRLLSETLRAEGKSPQLAVDTSKITGHDSQARTVAKQIGTLGLERIAIFGGRRSLPIVGNYLIRASGAAGYTKFFRHRAEALRWLNHGQRTASTRILKVLGLIVFSIGLLGLLGWAFDNVGLRALLPQFKPMNPVVAVLFMVAAILVIAAKLGNNTKRWRGIAALFGFILIFFGISVLVGYFTEFDLHGDTWLFHSRLDDGYFSGRAAPSVAFHLTLLGTMLLMTLHRPMRLWQKISFHVCSVLLFSSVTFILIAYAFGFINLSPVLPMPLNTALCLILLNHALQDLTQPLSFFALRKQIVDRYWQAALIFIAVMGLTGIAYQQSISDIQTRHSRAVTIELGNVRNNINNHLNAYTSALYGFRAFFESSEVVSADEFTRYFKNSQLLERYPGFNAISFLRNVPRSQKQAFETEIRNTASANHQYYKHYKVFPQSNSASLFPLVFFRPQPSTRSLGFDLSSNTVRRATLERARDTGRPTASSQIDLNDSRVEITDSRPGFFIAMPVYKANETPTSTKERREKIYGFVNAVFEDSRLFKDIFKEVNGEVKYVITNAKTHETLHIHNPSLKTGNEPLKRERIHLAGQAWNVAIYGSPSYGVSPIERNLPPSLLFGGTIVALLAALLFIAQVRRRGQALELASQMTEDLNNERNHAIATQQKDEAILSSIGDAVFAIDTKERITLFNPAAERVSGFSAAEAIGKPYTSILEFASEKDSKPYTHFIKKALKGELSAMKANTILLRKDGRRVPVADSAAPIRNAKGELLGAIIVFRDVSKERELDKAKTEFVSLASHQLRTPLSSIGWYSEMLLTGDAGQITKQQREYLTEIHEGNSRMVELVNSLLDVSRLDLGKLTNEPKPVTLADLITSIESELATSITEKGITVNKKISKVNPVVADPKLLRMIIQNLLSNAVKYTAAKGSVTITLRHVTTQDMKAAKLTSHKPHIFLSVQDTGYGIPKSQQHKVFSKLFRADNVRALDVEGTGLGLYIVKEVVEKLGGSVWFESMESVGTTFYVVLPEVPKVRKESR